MIAFGMITKPKRPKSQAQRRANALFSAAMGTPKSQDRTKSMVETLHRLTGMRCGR